jgi:Neuraminidase (sialidase)
MVRLLLYCLLFPGSLLAQVQLADIPVFISGAEGHQSYRIPAIIGLSNGDLLAFAEGGVQGAADFGDINIVMKRSTDKGKTWGTLQTVADNDSLQAGNAADTRRRDNLTLRISYDEGKTWPRQYLVAKSPDARPDYAAYSDLVQTGRKTLGVLYEKDGYKQIVFSVVKWK